MPGKGNTFPWLGIDFRLVLWPCTKSDKEAFGSVAQLLQFRPNNEGTIDLCTVEAKNRERRHNVHVTSLGSSGRGPYTN